MRSAVALAVLACLAACGSGATPADGGLDASEVRLDSSAREDAGSQDAYRSTDASEDAYLLGDTESEDAYLHDAYLGDADLDDDAGTATLSAEAGSRVDAWVNEDVVLDGSGSQLAIEYQWAPGGGLPAGPRGASPTLTVRYPEPGRYTAVLTVRDASGRRRTDSTVVTVTRRPVHTPRSSSTIAIVGDHLIAVLSQDADELTIARWEDTGTLSIVRRLPTCDDPRTLSPWRDRVAVACQSSAEIWWIDPSGEAPAERFSMPRASAPFGVAGRDEGPLWVSLQATGHLARVELDPGQHLSLVDSDPVVTDPRGVALLPDASVAVTRWRSPDDEGQIAIFDPLSQTSRIVSLAFDPQPSSDTEIGGVPSYLEQIAIAPDGRSAAVASTQAAIHEGAFRTGGARALTFQTTVRAVVSFLDLVSTQESAGDRVQLDNRGLANAAVYSARGDWLFVSSRGTRTVERLDVAGGSRAARLSGTLQRVGHALTGLALSPDDRFLFVDASLSRELVMYDVTDYRTEPAALARVSTVSAEPLAPDILLGKQLFNDALDPRLGRDGYIACAHCHLDGQDDHRVWDFSDRGEGLRNTQTLIGHAGTGAIHWSANFDELQDFEHDIRGEFGGTGLMSDADFHTGTRDTTLGDPKAGVSAELDALAAYVSSLGERPRSPYRESDGSLSPAAERGRAIFDSATAGCTDCHAGPRLTDSGFSSPGAPVLHDVGTLGAGSGQRLGSTLTGLDTPSLTGIWASPPYLHDGSAPTLLDVITTRNGGDRHGRTSQLTGTERDDLIAYLLALE